jgi:hypothetical protein
VRHLVLRAPQALPDQFAEGTPVGHARFCFEELALLMVREAMVRSETINCDCFANMTEILSHRYLAGPVVFSIPIDGLVDVGELEGKFCVRREYQGMYAYRLSSERQ